MHNLLELEGGGSDRSHMFAIELKAEMRFLSVLKPRPHLSREDLGKSPEVPSGMEITVESPPPVSRGLDLPPTRLGSLPLDSLLEKVRHSEVSSTQ